MDIGASAARSSLPGSIFGPSGLPLGPKSRLETNGHVGGPAIPVVALAKLASADGGVQRRNRMSFQMIRRLWTPQPPQSGSAVPRNLRSAADGAAVPADAEDGIKASLGGGTTMGRSTSPGSVGGRRRGLVRRALSWLGSLSYRAVNRVVRRLSSVVGPSATPMPGGNPRAPAAGGAKPGVSSSREGVVGADLPSSPVTGVSGAAGGRNAESDSQTAPKLEAKGSHPAVQPQRHSNAVIPSTATTAGNTVSMATGDNVHQKPGSYYFCQCAS